MATLYDLARAVYAGDIAAAQAACNSMASTDFTVLRARLAAGLSEGTVVVPLDNEVQARLADTFKPQDVNLLPAGAGRKRAWERR